MAFRCIQEHQEFGKIVKVDEIVDDRPQYVGKTGWWENLDDPEDDDQVEKKKRGPKPKGLAPEGPPADSAGDNLDDPESQV